MMKFKEWLIEHTGTPAAKQSLYPSSYGGLGLYSIPDYMNWASDAVTYMPSSNRYLKFKWGNGILGNPFRSDSLYSKIEGKQAPQIEAGTLKTNGKRFEKSPQYVRTLPLDPKLVDNIPPSSLFYK